MTSSATYTKEVVYIPVYANEVMEIEVMETLEKQIDRVALAHKIATTSLFNLVECESQFDPLADNGDDRGIVQISRIYQPQISDEQAFDVEWALNWAANEIAEDRGYLWTCGSCVAFSRAMGVDLPRYVNGAGLNADDIFPNTEIPSVGSVLILKYSNGSHHLIPIVKGTIQPDGFHAVSANKEPYKITREILPYDSKLIMGIYDPEINK